MGEVSRDFARALDPAQIMVAAGLPPDPWQADLLRSEHNRHLLLCSRQSGKSTTCAALAVHGALYDPGLTLLIAPAQRQSSELFRKVMEIYHALDDVPRITNESALRLELANKSRIVALPGTEATIRGFSGAKTIILDEASRVEESLIAAVRPMLITTQGRFIALTTPFGQRGWFYEQWEHGGARWHRTKITAHDCPRITKADLENELAELGDWAFRSEYLCQFVDTTEQLFSSAMIEAALTSEVQPLWKL